MSVYGSFSLGEGGWVRRDEWSTQAGVAAAFSFLMRMQFVIFLIGVCGSER